MVRHPQYTGALILDWCRFHFTESDLLYALIMTGYIMFLATDTAQTRVRYGATFLIASGAFPFAALCNAQVSANVISDSARSGAIGT